jgi:uncharacterized protein YgbK (DUF1537 family)
MIARDLTGALDSLAAFVETPGDTVVLLAPEASPGDAGNIAVVAETELAGAEEAHVRVRDAARRLKGYHLFKRVGSTLRGNIGREIRAVIDETGTRAVVCSALPREGRTVVGGVGLLNSVPLHLTEYGRDPTSPCLESSLPTLLQQDGLHAVAVPLDTVREGVEALCRALVETTAEAAVVDAETDDDMRIIARALGALGTDWCACASSGLSPHLAEALGRSGEARRCKHLVRSDGGVLVVLGTTNSVSAAQVARLGRSRDVWIVPIEAHGLCAGDADVERWEEESVAALVRGRIAVMTTSYSPVVPHLFDQVAAHLGMLAARVARRSGASAVVLSGGQTSLSVCKALGVASVQVLGEIEPGVVCSSGADGHGIERSFVSKAGGFGDAGTLARVLGLERPGAAPV